MVLSYLEFTTLNHSAPYTKPHLLPPWSAAPFNHTFRCSLTAGVCASVAAVALFPGPAASASVIPDEAEPQQNDLASRFTLGILPDTQFYSRYATEDTGDLFNDRYGSDPFDTQTSWLAENADELNLPFVTHLDDVVDQVYVSAEWPVADAAMQNWRTAVSPTRSCRATTT